ncbi:MAG: ankyrin repeat domain-containing protein [Gammaproteobacteria bacterium]
MMKIKALCEAATENNLIEVTRLIQQEKVDPNGLEGDSNMRPIDYAARAGHLGMVQRLYDLGAKLKTNFDKESGILYWTCWGENVQTKKEILNWLQCSEVIKSQHVKAALGVPPSDEIDKYQTDEHGLYPYHYAGLWGMKLGDRTRSINIEEVGEKNFLSWLPASSQEELEEHLLLGSDKGFFDTLVEYLYQHEQYYLLFVLWDLYSKLNTNPLSEKVSNKAAELAKWLAYACKWELFHNFLERNPNLALSNAPAVEDGTTVLVYLVRQLAFHEQWGLLKKFGERLNLKLYPLLTVFPVQCQYIDSYVDEDRYEHKNVTLVGLLLEAGELELFENILKGTNEYSNMTNQEWSSLLNENSLVEILIKHEKFQLLEYISKLCSFEGVRIQYNQLQAVEKENEGHAKFKEILLQIMIKQLHHDVINNIEEYETYLPNDQQNLQEKLELMLSLLLELPKDSSHYQENSFTLGTALLNCSKIPGLSKFIIEKFPIINVTQSNIYSPQPPEAIKLYVFKLMSHLGENGEHFNINFLIELLYKMRQLSIENDELKKKVKQLENEVPSASEKSSEILAAKPANQNIAFPFWQDKESVEKLTASSCNAFEPAKPDNSIAPSPSPSMS